MNQKGGRTLGVIPARLGSTRLPKKMLIPVMGKPLLYYTWKQTSKARTLDSIVVATDSKEIFDAVEQFGGSAVMTSSDHQSGSDRVAEAARTFATFDPEIIVNIQGDEPVISPEAIDAAARVLIDDTSVSVGTVATPFTDPADIEKPGFVKLVADTRGHILYCSRAVIPYPRNPYTGYLKHLGIYSFRKDTLQKFVQLKQTPLELAEGLEQNRLLENGISIKVTVGTFESISVDTAEDLENVKQMLSKSLTT